jgi:hypothetical protein
MNRYHLGADLPSVAGRYVGCMRAGWRAKAADPGTVLDVGLAVCGAGLTALALWGPPALTGTTVAGPSWLLAVLPLIMGAPLVLMLTTFNLDEYVYRP